MARQKPITPAEKAQLASLSELKEKRGVKKAKRVDSGEKYKSYSTDQGMMVPGFNTSGQFVGYSLKRPQDKTKKYAGGGRAMRGYGKAYMKGGRVK